VRSVAALVALSFVFPLTFGCERSGAGPAATPTTAPATAPATQPTRRLGILLIDLNDYDHAEEQIRAFGGHLVVNKVDAGTRAADMGLRVGDVIQRVNGKDMATVFDVLSAVQAAESLKIEILRDGKSVTVGG
jgi:hypothetical protein